MPHLYDRKNSGMTKQENSNKTNKNTMSKIYKCAKNCGSVEESDSDKAPICCGISMIEVKEDEELFGCAGCCSRCDAGCGDGKK